MFKGRSSYSEFLRAGEGIATNILADRLERLQQDDLVRQLPDGRYQPTEKALALLPLLVEMIVWSATYDPDTAAPDEFVERARNDRATLLQELRSALMPAEENTP